MGTKKSAQFIRQKILEEVKNSQINYKKKELIAWAIIDLCMSKRYASEIVQAFIDGNKITEILTGKEIYLA